MENSFFCDSASEYRDILHISRQHMDFTIQKKREHRFQLTAIKRWINYVCEKSTGRHPAGITAPDAVWNHW